MTARRSRYRQVAENVIDLTGATDAAPIRLVSFDVFDTLVQRRSSRAAVHDRVARELVRRLAAVNARPAADVLGARRHVERQLCELAVHEGLEGEFFIGDLFGPLIERCIGDQLDATTRAELADDMAEFEVLTELRTCRAIPGMRAEVARIKAIAHRLVFVSDMYLGAHNVGRILDACGYAGLFDAGYASGDSKLYKATGRAFEALLTDEAVAAADVVHVGDHELADERGPAQLGINTVRIVDRCLDEVRVRDTLDHPAGVHGAAVALDAWCRPADLSTETVTQRYIRNTLGPIFCGFVHQVRETARADDVDVLYFLSRDGFVPMRIYETTRHVVGPPAHYLITSRLPTVRSIMVDGLGMKPLMSARNQLVPAQRTIANTLDSLGLDGDLVRDVCATHGLDPQKQFDDALLQHPRLLSVVNDRRLISAARAVGAQHHRLLIDYLTQEGFFGHRRVGLVDIGWGGTIQDQLFDALQHDERAPELFGYYFGGNRSMFERRTPANRMSPMISSVFSHTGGMYLGNSATFAGIGLLEEAARAPHGTCTGYRRDGAAVEPLLKPDAERVAEAAGEPHLAVLQAAVVDYARAYFDGVDFLGVSTTATTALAHHALARMVYFPTGDELTIWKQLTHTNDIGGLFEITEQLLPPDEPAAARWRDWRAKTRASMWTHGSVRYLLGPLGALAYIGPWSMSYAKKVQADLNIAAAGSPLDQPRVRRRRPVYTEMPTNSPSTSVYEAAVRRADKLAGEHDDRRPAGTTPALDDLVAAVGTLTAVGVARAAPRRLTGGVVVINDGLPAARLLRRRASLALAPGLVRLGRRSDRASRLVSTVARRVLRY